MSNDWFYSVAGVKHGPISSKELTELADTGVLKPSDLVWKEGLTEWKQAGKVKGLFTSPSTAPPLPQATTAPQQAISIDDEEKDPNIIWRSRSVPNEGDFPGLIGKYVGFHKWYREKIPFFGKLSGPTPKRKKFKENLTHRVKFSKVNEFGEKVELTKLLEHVALLYRNKGFAVKEHDGFLLLEKLSIEEGGINAQYHGLVRFSEKESAWVVVLKAEAIYVAAMMERFTTATVLICVAAIVFLPLICCIPFMFGADPEQIIKWTQTNLQEPLDQLVREFQ